MKSLKNSGFSKVLKESEITKSWIPEYGKKVSIICAAYNFENYISDTLNGFLMQKTNFAFEILIGDDCSSDRTLEILREYEKKYPKIVKIVSRNVNIGGDHNWADLLKKSNSEYIANCDGDDYWVSAEKLQNQIDILDKNKDIGLVFTDVNFINQDNKIIAKDIFKTKKLKIFQYLDEVLINKPYLAPSTWVYRRNLHSRVIDKDYGYVDQTFPLLLEVLKVSKIKFMPETTSNYRVRNESQTNTKDFYKRLNFLKGIFRIQIKYAEEEIGLIKFQSIIKNKFYRMALPYSIICNDKSLENECIEHMKVKKLIDIKILFFLTISKLPKKNKLIYCIFIIKETKIFKLFLNIIKNSRI